MDQIDRKIVRALQQDGRMTVLDLAEKVGLSPTPCARRLDRLRDAGSVVLAGQDTLVGSGSTFELDFSTGLKTSGTLLEIHGLTIGIVNIADELDGTADQAWETLSGGQQARLQILLLELDGANLLLLDEPTDNLDVASAEALEAGLAVFEGTVLCVTHDRWFLRGFDRFVAFTEDAEVREVSDPAIAWKESKNRS